MTLIDSHSSESTESHTGGKYQCFRRVGEYTRKSLIECVRLFTVAGTAYLLLFAIPRAWCLAVSRGRFPWRGALLGSWNYDAELTVYADWISGLCFLIAFSILGAATCSVRHPWRLFGMVVLSGVYVVMAFVHVALLD